MFKPDKSKGLNCYVYADFSGGWSRADANDAYNILSETGFIIMCANVPVYWVSKLHTEVALITEEAKHINLSQALRKFIPLTVRT